jgi:hypothetical protein
MNDPVTWNNASVGDDVPDPDRYYCIVCKSHKSFGKVGSVIAEVRDEGGGWHCGWHTHDEVDQALRDLKGKLVDRLGVEW